jgi:hypothetical protein
MNTPHDNHDLRVKALCLTETQVRKGLDRLLEQCGLEELGPGTVHVQDIYTAFGIRRQSLLDAVEEGGSER